MKTERTANAIVHYCLRMPTARCWGCIRYGLVLPTEALYVDHMGLDGRGICGRSHRGGHRTWRVARCTCARCAYGARQALHTMGSGQDHVIAWRYSITGYAARVAWAFGTCCRTARFALQLSKPCSRSRWFRRCNAATWGGMRYGRRYCAVTYRYGCVVSYCTAERVWCCTVPPTLLTAVELFSPPCLRAPLPCRTCM